METKRVGMDSTEPKRFIVRNLMTKRRRLSLRPVIITNMCNNLSCVFAYHGISLELDRTANWQRQTFRGSNGRGVWVGVQLKLKNVAIELFIVCWFQERFCSVLETLVHMGDMLLPTQSAQWSGTRKLAFLHATACIEKGSDFRQNFQLNLKYLFVN